MYSVGIAGTAKNTGKTTTLQSLIELAQRENICTGITSIGFDGEWKDNITGLPKPRVHVQEGMMVGVAIEALLASSCKIKILKKTGIQSALGEIVTGEVIEPGLLITAGPNKSHDLEKLQKMMQEHGCQIFFVDGALNRIIPFILADSIILATGAARYQDIRRLAEDAASFDLLFHYPIQEVDLDLDSNRFVVQLVGHSSSSIKMSFGSLLTSEQVKQTTEKVNDHTKIIHIPGAVQVEALNELICQLEDKSFKGMIHLTSILHLIPGNDLDRINSVLRYWTNRGGQWGVKRLIPLIAVTVNPFYPAFRFAASSYTKGYVDSDQLFNEVQKSVTVPVFDIKRDGSDSLWNIIRKGSLLD